MSGSAAIRKVVQQFRDNRRLGGLGAAVLAALAFLAVDSAVSALRAQSAELAELVERRERLEALSGSTAWFQREEAAESLLATLEAGIPPAASHGMAQAIFQGWLRERTVGMDGNVSAEVATPQPVDDPALPPSLVRVTATVTGRSHRNTVIDLVRRVEASKSLITVDAFSISANPEEGFTLTLSAYFRLEAAPGDGA